MAERAAGRLRAEARTRATGRDTFPLVVGVQAAQQTAAVQDSILRALQVKAEARSATPALSPEVQRSRDSVRALLAQLESALERAAKAPLPASYRALAGTKAMRTTGSVPALVDTLDLLDRVRRTMDPVAAPEREFAQLSERANAIGETLQQLGQLRRALLIRQGAVLEADATRRAADDLVIDTLPVRLARDSAQRLVSRAESALRDARRWHATLESQADSAAHAQAERLLGASPIATALSVLVMVLVLSFTVAVIAESRRPTIAHAREVERLTGVPVLATAFEAQLPREGRARLQSSSGIDPFRMLYLALTASGTRERTACVTGSDPAMVATVAGRLAVSAAADDHATLAVDVAPGAVSTSRYFGERSEPGFSEAIALVRLWREVARPVGASEGLGLDIVPAGAPRPDIEQSVQGAANRDEFLRFCAEYDFTVIAAPTIGSLATVAALNEHEATIYVAQVGETTLIQLSTDIAGVRASGCSLYGILLIDRMLKQMAL
jgi:Mrp family chromosome partitioning ATPase